MTSDSDCFNLTNPAAKCHKTQQNSNIQQKLLKTCILLFSFQMMFYNVFYKETNKKLCHYIPNIMQYPMTLHLTNDIQLQLGFSPKLDQL